MPCHHAQQRRQHHHGDTHRRTGTAQHQAVHGSHSSCNGGGHTAAHHARHGQHNGTPVKKHTRCVVDRVGHAQQGNHAKQQAEHPLAVFGLVVSAREHHLADSDQGDQEGDVVDEVGKHASMGRLKR